MSFLKHWRKLQRIDGQDELMHPKLVASTAAPLTLQSENKIRTRNLTGPLKNSRYVLIPESNPTAQGNLWFFRTSHKRNFYKARFLPPFARIRKQTFTYRRSKIAYHTHSFDPYLKKGRTKRFTSSTTINILLKCCLDRSPISALFDRSQVVSKCRVLV